MLNNDFKTLLTNTLRNTSPRLVLRDALIILGVLIASRLLTNIFAGWLQALLPKEYGVYIEQFAPLFGILIGSVGVVFAFVNSRDSQRKRLDANTERALDIIERARLSGVSKATLDRMYLHVTEKYLESINFAKQNDEKDPITKENKAE